MNETDAYKNRISNMKQNLNKRIQTNTQSNRHQIQINNGDKFKQLIQNENCMEDSNMEYAKNQLNQSRSSSAESPYMRKNKKDERSNFVENDMDCHMKFLLNYQRNTNTNNFGINSNIKTQNNGGDRQTKAFSANKVISHEPIPNNRTKISRYDVPIKESNSQVFGGFSRNIYYNQLSKANYNQLYKSTNSKQALPYSSLLSNSKPREQIHKESLGNRNKNPRQRSQFKKF